MRTETSPRKQNLEFSVHCLTLNHQIKTTNIFVNTQAPSYLTKRTVFKAQNDLEEKRVPICSKATIEPFPSKVRIQRNISYWKIAPSPLTTSIARDINIEEKRVVKSKPETISPFENRYSKEVPKKIDYVKYIIEGAKVLMNKVIR